ncbi:mucin-5AC-like [Scleropages formosus]|uniref:Mucin-5AC n=1 Tax=Scleropages formosus TaxID=113540 RepID=A0A8C9RQB2_SCLFO|nr:mucin-5AC [Scleropages formosus]XP_018621495.1 mucin-5AC [Scleropages formosus]
MAASLLLHAALLWASASSSATAAEQCFSKVHPDLIVNASAAFLAKSTVLDAHASPSQQACLLDCCSQEGFKCNWAVYKPDKPAGSENCYLFHCERQDDCPLIPMTGVNTYNILKGLDYPSKNHLTTATMTTRQPTTTMTSLSTSNTQPTTTVTSLSTTNMQPITTMTSLSTGNIPPTSITSLSTSKVQPTTIISLSTSKVQPTTMTSLSTSNTQPTTATVSLSTSNTEQITIMKLLPTRNTQPTTTMTSLTPITKKPATTTTLLATIMMSLSTTVRQTRTTVTSLSTATSPLTATTTQPATNTARSTSTAARAVTSATQPTISSAITATSITTTTQPGAFVTTALQNTMTTTQATKTSTVFRKPFSLTITPLTPTTSSTQSTTTATARTFPTTTTTATLTTLPTTATTSERATTIQVTTIITKPTRSFIPMQVTSKIMALTEHPATSTEMQILKSVTAKKGHITNTQTLTAGATLSKSGVQTAAAITAIKAVNVTGKNRNKAARKEGTKTAEHSTSQGSATGGTALPVRLLPNPAKPSSAVRPSGGPHKAGSRKPKTHMRTTARPVTLAPKVVTVMSSASTVKLTAVSTATHTAPRNPDKKPEHKAAGYVHPVPPSSNPAHANPPRRRSDHQGRLKSSLEVTVVVGLVFLTLAIALVGRKAMESFNRRQYTRLELNDLYYDV